MCWTLFLRSHKCRDLVSAPLTYWAESGTVITEIHYCNQFVFIFLNMWNGNFTRFADWRLIHRARLDRVPLNGSQQFGGRNEKCHRCGYANETLPHVLCHCKPNFMSITKRHNAIQGRLLKAFNAPASTEVRVNQGYLEWTELSDPTSWQ